MVALAASTGSEKITVRLNDFEDRKPSATMVRFDPAQLSSETVPNLGSTCNVEVINGSAIGDRKITEARRSAIAIEGWAFDPAVIETGEGTFALLGDASSPRGPTYSAKATRRIARQDVVEAFKLKHDPIAGFEVRGDLSLVPAGEYALFLKVAHGRRIFLCDSRRKLRVVD